MTKILHVSDTHLGYRQYGSDTRREDLADAFEAAIDLGIGEDVDAIIHTGDLFDDPQPGVPDLNRCLTILSKLDQEGIPFYAIVGNHERKLDEQWLDLFEGIGVVERLDTSPTRVGDAVALYGIDAIRAPSWNTYDFSLEKPPDDVDITILCLHHLFEELVPPQKANYVLSQVINRLNYTPTAVALGDYHGYEETTVEGVQAFYPGSTERCSTNEVGHRGVLLLEVEDGELTTRRRQLDTPADEAPRKFLQVPIQFGEDDGLSLVGDRLDEATPAGETLEEKVLVVQLHGKDVGVSQRDVYELSEERGAAVIHVQDKRQAEVDVEFDIDEADVSDINSMIDDRLGELDLAKTSVGIEEVVRATNGTADSNVRDEVNDLLEEARANRFDDVDQEATMEGDT